MSITQTAPYTKMYKHIQKQEIITFIIDELRHNPKITNKELAVKLRCHRHTISKYRNHIREVIITPPKEIVNKIDSKLNDELEQMPPKLLIEYRRALMPPPEQIEIKEEIRDIQIKWDICQLSNSSSPTNPTQDNKNFILTPQDLKPSHQDAVGEKQLLEQMKQSVTLQKQNQPV